MPSKPPPTLSPTELIAVLDRALREPIGLSVSTTRPDLLKAQMESVRLPRHAGLDLTIPSIVEQLFIRKKGPGHVP